MEQRVTVVTVSVADVGRARDFYVKRLGWHPTLDLPEVLFLQVAHGVLLSLYGAADFAQDLGVAPAAVAGVTLACNVEDEGAVDAAVAAWQAAGGRVVRPPRRASWGGWFAHVADPDGLVWEIAHNPGLAVAPDGRVTVGPVG